VSKKPDIKPPERAIVVGCGLKSDSFTEIKESLSELEELAYAAGAEVVGTAVQILPKYVPATLIGSGKIEEIKELVTNTQANLVVIDHSLTGSQSRNLRDLIGVSVLDRSQLILDIFAQRAQSYEGKLQVELAQMLDQLPRMVGGWLGSLSRLGGGIGTRGPGETALEMDRRRIRERMQMIRQKLDDVGRNRAQYRQSRKRSKVPSFALIGYTNAGKSTLLNKLTQANVLVRDQVFATLDPTTRQVFLPEVKNAVITDTVGFIRNLPTHLIEAFKSTLEESGEADVLLHVIDLSSPHSERQIEIVENLITEFKWDAKPIIHVLNKVDITPVEKQLKVKLFPRVFVSAHTGVGLDKLKNLMTEMVLKSAKEVELYFPKEEEYRIYELGREAQISRRENAPNGTVCIVSLTESQLSKWHKFMA
jgi:GTP-binding protein HflX